MSKDKITIQDCLGVKVLRDDLLPGGTKSIVLPLIISGAYSEYVYASPVYGGFQIALAKYCANVGKKATIFCAFHNHYHDNTREAERAGAKIIEVPCGYLNVVEARANDYVMDKCGSRYKITFGGDEPGVRKLLIERVRKVMRKLGQEPDEIWCAIGSGLLFECILAGTFTAKVHGVVVGKPYVSSHLRAKIWHYPIGFDKISRYPCPFPSMPNYDLKAWEFCQINHKYKKEILFWNVL